MESEVALEVPGMGAFDMATADCTLLGLVNDVPTLI